MQLFSAEATMFLFLYSYFFAHENMKKRPQKLIIISPIFSVMPTSPNPAQISILVP